MIPSLPNSVSDEDSLDFYSKIAGNLSDQSSIHVNWHTHRGNPSVCWICDTNILISILLRELERVLSKSALDIRTDNLSERESDSEIESEENGYDYNHDEEVMQC